MLNNSNPTHKEEENCISPALEISKENAGDAFFSDSNENEPEIIEVKEIYIAQSEPPFVCIKFNVDGMETDRFLEPRSLWMAIHHYTKNHLKFPKTDCNID